MGSCRNWRGGNCFRRLASLPTLLEDLQEDELTTQSMTTFRPLCAYLLLLGHLSLAPAQNLIANPSFEDGLSGFASQYRLATNRWALYGEGTFALQTNSSAWHDAFATMADHTTGSGAMMVVNGSPTGTAILWSQEINIATNTVYLFSAWVANLVGSKPPEIVLRVNGVDLSTSILPIKEVGVWRSISGVWKSSADAKAYLEIVSRSKDAIGNDFAVDDLSFRTMGEEDVSVSISRAVWLTWMSTIGVDYQIQTATGFAPWANVGKVIAGTGGIITHCEESRDPRAFYRVISLRQ